MNQLADLQATRGCHCLVARKQARSLTRLYEEYLRPHRLRATQFSILAALAVKGATRIGELANMLALERTTLTRSAALLQARGWIADGKTDDGRERLLCVTDAGHAVLHSAFPAWREAQQAAAERLRQGAAKQATVSGESPMMAERQHQSREFVARALRDFGVEDSFGSRPQLEREQCLRWIAGSEGEHEEERRVSRLVDDLISGRPLPGVRTPQGSA